MSEITLRVALRHLDGWLFVERPAPPLHCDLTWHIGMRFFEHKIIAPIYHCGQCVLADLVVAGIIVSLSGEILVVLDHKSHVVYESSIHDVNGELRYERSGWKVVGKMPLESEAKA